MTDPISSRHPAWTVAVLAGGQSAEREVSLRSGVAVTAALRAGGHRVIELDPVRDDITSVNWRRVSIGTSSSERFVSVDAVFIALHGAFGEDGELQNLLENRNVPFTGADALASYLAFNKSAAKQRFIADGIATPTAALIRATDPAGFARSAAHSIGYPVVIKPDRQGSSIGVTIVPSPALLEAALAECFRFDSSGLIEAAVLGDEWTVAMIDDEPLPPIRIGTSRQFYDYTAKYAADDTQYAFDDASPSLIKRISALGRSACRAIGTRGLARVDIRLDLAGLPYVLEVNTIPGMTDHSLVPKAAARVGLSMTALCERAIQSALDVHHARNNSHVRPGPSPTLLHRRAG